MNSLRKRLGIALVLVVGMLTGSIASATPITMDFNGLTPGASVHTYYNGGCTKLGFLKFQCHGPDDGVVWKGASVGYSANAPSAPGFAGLLFSDHATMNVAAGFDSALSFDYYNAFLLPGSVSIYSGRNGHGTRLAHATLQRNVDWNLLNLTFSGVAKSVIFDISPVYFTGFDNVTLGADTPVQPVPEPAMLGMFGLGMLLVGTFASLRRRLD